MTDTAESAPEEQPGAAVGQRLKSERERQTLSTRQVAERLHLDNAMIEALESSRFSTLGPPVFVKGYLQQYANLLGLDARSLLALYEEEHAPAPRLEPLKPAMRLGRRRRVIYVLLGLLLLALIAMGWRVLSQRQVNAGEAGPVRTTDESPSTAQMALPVEPSGESPATATTATMATMAITTALPEVGKTEEIRAAGQVEVAKAAPPDSAGAATGMELRLRFAAESWVEIYDAGGTQLLYDLCAADTGRTVRGAPPLRVFLGNADGVQLNVGGRELQVPRALARGEVMRFTLAADGVFTPWAPDRSSAAVGQDQE